MIRVCAEVLKFEKMVDGRTVECEIQSFEDGSVGVFGPEIDTWIFEFTQDALDRAMMHVTDAGYVRSQNDGSTEP
jgi:hypothetical protein